VHPREDRRHIQDRDVHLLRETLVTRMNLEMAVTEAMLAFAEQVRPEHCCFVPEKREELTTEGTRRGQTDRARCGRLPSDGRAGLGRYHSFIDPERGQIDAAAACGARAIELHTGNTRWPQMNNPVRGSWCV